MTMHVRSRVFPLLSDAAQFIKAVSGLYDVYIDTKRTHALQVNPCDPLALLHVCVHEPMQGDTCGQELWRASSDACMSPTGRTLVDSVALGGGAGQYEIQKH